MIVILITGTPGVGKTTLLPALADRLGEKCAYLDGDVVGRTRPLTRTVERMNLIQDNIVACAANFAEWGARYFATAFVFGSEERIERIRGKLRAAGHAVVAVGLVADDNALVERIRLKGDDHGTDQDSINSTLAINNGIRQLPGVHILDSTDLTVEQVAEQIAGLL